MALYKHAECAAGGEEIVLLIFGQGKQPRKGKKSKTSAGAAGKKEDTSYVQDVRDNGDGTWTAVVRNAQKDIGAKWEKLCGGKKDEGSSADRFSACSSRVISNPSDRQRASQKDGSFAVQQHARARKEEGVASLNCYRADRESEEMRSRSNGIPGAHPGSVGDFGSPESRGKNNKRVDDEEMKLLLANLGDLHVEEIEQVVITQPKPKENGKDKRELEHFYRQASNFHLPRNTEVKDDTYWRKKLDEMARVRELDTFAFGKFDALVLDNDVEDSVFASQQFIYVKPAEKSPKSSLQATPFSHALDATPLNSRTSQQKPSKVQRSSGGSPAAGYTDISAFAEKGAGGNKQVPFDAMSDKSLDFLVTPSSPRGVEKKSPVHKAGSDKSLNILLGSSASITDRKNTKQSIEVVDETGSKKSRMMKIVNASDYSVPQAVY